MSKIFLDYVEDLSWYQLDEAQEEAVRCLIDTCMKRPNALSLIIQTTTEKHLWQNEALVVCAQKDALLERYAQRLLMWLQDLNWPGAEQIFDRLVIMDEKAIDHHIQDAKRWAEEDNDLGWLACINELIAERNKYWASK